MFSRVPNISSPQKSLTFSDEDITYTNWGITAGGEFEPLDDTALLCASICLGNLCNDTYTWKTESCDTPLQFVCQIQCEYC